MKSFTALSSDLKKILNSSSIHDMKLVSESGDAVPVHKSILSARCDYFKSMFNSNFMEASLSELPLTLTTEALKVR